AMLVIVVPAGMPVPVIVIPFARPAAVPPVSVTVVPVVIVATRENVRMPVAEFVAAALSVTVVALGTAVIVVFAGMPVPVTTMPTDRPVVLGSVRVTVAFVVADRSDSLTVNATAVAVAVTALLIDTVLAVVAVTVVLAGMPAPVICIPATIFAVELTLTRV